MLAAAHLPSPCGDAKFRCQAANFARRRSFRGVLAKIYGDVKFNRRRRILPGGEVSAADLPRSVEMSNSIARRRSLPGGEVSAAHLPSPAEMSNSIARRRILPGGEIFAVHMLALRGCQIQSQAANFSGWRSFCRAFARLCGDVKFNRQATNFAGR